MCVKTSIFANLIFLQIKETSRDQLEKDLEFAGFVIISCPLKQDSKAVVKEILNASHHVKKISLLVEFHGPNRTTFQFKVTMITGDNPLTACHVARELRFCRTKTTLILTRGNGGDGGDDSDAWEWRSVDETQAVPMKMKVLFRLRGNVGQILLLTLC